MLIFGFLEILQNDPFQLLSTVISLCIYLLKTVPEIPIFHVFLTTKHL